MENSLPRSEIESKAVLEVGSRDVNGSIRNFVGALNPEKYIGIDIVDGPGVDMICDAHEMKERFTSETFDVIIATEMLEHVKDWRKVI